MHRSILSKIDMNYISSNALSLIDSVGVKLSKVEWFYDEEDQEALFSFQAESATAEQLAKLNSEMAWALAKNDNLIGKDFTVIFTNSAL